MEIFFGGDLATVACADVVTEPCMPDTLALEIRDVIASRLPGSGRIAQG
jgi:hypothetical protein